jgi:phosphoglucomutase
MLISISKGEGLPGGGARYSTAIILRNDGTFLCCCQHYTENFIQAIFDSIKAEGATLVIGGDGRYFSPETVQTILRIGSANGVKKFIVGKDSILSTPAASNVIRKYKADGGILLTASHNPGGPKNDFGIKYNVSNGGPAPENVTNKIYEITKTISRYLVIEADPVSSGTPIRLNDP